MESYIKWTEKLLKIQWLKNVIYVLLILNKPFYITNTEVNAKIKMR
jgi:hypothetical protein